MLRAAAPTGGVCLPDVDDPLVVVVITTFDLDEYVYGALKAGARGFRSRTPDPPC